MRARLPLRSALLPLALALSAHAVSAVDLPAGTRLSVRLSTRLSTHRSRPGDVVAATVIAPVREGEQVLLPAGAEVSGRVVEVGRRRHRPAIRVEFSQIAAGGEARPLQARVAEIDDARERVEPDGAIVGYARPALRPGVLEAALLVAAGSPIAAGLYEAGRLLRRSAQHCGVDYAPGVEASLELIQAVRLPDAPHAAPLPAADWDWAAD